MNLWHHISISTIDMDTLNNNGIHFDFTMDYRYFFMDSNYYYYELSDMSLALSNMIGNNKQGNAKSFENRNAIERYRDNGIRQYMWYTGFEDIEERNTGEVPYAIGHRDVFLRRGKVNHKHRNLITIVIGEDEGKKGEISANLDGEYGIDGEYKDYHHVGFDIEANKIVEDIEAYINNQNGEKVYWITGFGSGGSIANLVGQKLTDKKGVENVYCYTFESYPTINANNLQNNNNTRFSRYTNIFNILNDDNPLTKILDGSVGWYRYGRNVTGSAASVLSKRTNNVAKILGSNYIGHNGEAKYNGSPNIVRRILDGIVNGIKEAVRSFVDGLTHLVSGFTNTEPYEQTYVAPVNRTIDNKTVQNQVQGIIDKFKSIMLKGLELFFNPIDQVATEDSGDIEAVVLNTRNKEMLVGNMNLPSTTNPTEPLENILQCIEQMAKLYINHVSTYRSYLKADSNDANTHRSTNRAYEYLTVENEAEIGKYNSNDKKFTVKLSTEHTNKIKSDGGWFHYIYDRNSDLDNSNSIGNWFVRDDCSGFVKSVLKLSGKDFTGFDTSLINIASVLSEDLNVNRVSRSLSWAGYVAYVYNPNINAWCGVYYPKGNNELAIEPVPITDMSIDFLQPGDFLVTNGHVEFYVGDNYDKALKDVTNKTIRNQEKKKLTWTDANVTHNGNVAGKTLKGTEYVKEGTFSWGNVHDEFPTESKDGNRHYFYYDNVSHVFRHCECGNEPNEPTKHNNCEFNEKQYTVIWRKR